MNKEQKLTRGAQLKKKMTSKLLIAYYNNEITSRSYSRMMSVEKCLFR